jgi:predicted MPP superfamily phosphohydrolase
MYKLILKYVFIIAVVCSGISCRSISIKTYNLTSPMLEKESSIKIVLISDLHSEIFGNEQSILINMVRDANPDIVIMSGDIIDEKVPVTGTQLLLSGISGIAPIYYVMGNHEYMGNNVQDIREMLVSYGIIILSDSYEIIEVNNYKIVLAGIEDPFKKLYETFSYNQEESMENAFRELDGIRMYKILIAHRPEYIEIYKRYSFDLILSGHTHGGQVRLPYGLYAYNQGVFPKYDGGMYKHGALTHIISRGLAYRNPNLPRIFNPPEFVVIVIGNAP